MAFLTELDLKQVTLTRILATGQGLKYMLSVMKAFMLIYSHCMMLLIFKFRVILMMVFHN
jgi:hypothetical protein